VTEPATKPLRTWRPMAAWTAGMLQVGQPWPCDGRGGGEDGARRMNPMRSAAILLLAVLATLTSGCSPRGYFTDRWADAKDVFTATAGWGGGAKARVGPLDAGLFVNVDLAGLRGGECFFGPGGEPAGYTDAVALLMLGGEWFEFTFDEFGSLRTEARNKTYAYVFMPPSEIRFPKSPSYYTDVQIAVGLGPTVRLGFNIGELLDFVLGWTTLDIYGDDIEARKGREEAKKPKEKPPEAPSPPPLAPPERKLF
jgi:hypothetical protein